MRPLPGIQDAGDVDRSPRRGNSGRRRRRCVRCRGILDVGATDLFAVVGIQDAGAADLSPVAAIQDIGATDLSAVAGILDAGEGVLWESTWRPLP